MKIHEFDHSVEEENGMEEVNDWAAEFIRLTLEQKPTAAKDLFHEVVRARASEMVNEMKHGAISEGPEDDEEDDEEDLDDESEDQEEFDLDDESEDEDEDLEENYVFVDKKSGKVLGGMARVGEKGEWHAVDKNLKVVKKVHGLPASKPLARYAMDALGIHPANADVKVGRDVMAGQK